MAAVGEQKKKTFSGLVSKHTPSYQDADSCSGTAGLLVNLGVEIPNKAARKWKRWDSLVPCSGAGWQGSVSVT